MRVEVSWDCYEGGLAFGMVEGESVGEAQDGTRVGGKRVHLVKAQSTKQHAEKGL